MRMSDLFPATYIKQEDVPVPVILIITQVKIESIGGGREKEDKPVVYFSKTEKGLVLNRTNGEVLAEAFGEDSDLWIGKTVQLYADPNVVYAGKRVGGLRLRVVTQQDNANGQLWTVQQAMDYASYNGVVWDDVVKSLKSTGKDGWYPPSCTQVAKDYIDNCVKERSKLAAANREEEKIPF